MNAEKKHALLERLRYELRMAEGFASEINNAGRAITRNDSIQLGVKTQLAASTAIELRDLCAKD